MPQRIRNKLYNWSGIHVGKNANINRGCYFVDSSKGNLIHIGDRATIAPGVIFIASSEPDSSILREYGLSKCEKIIVDDDAWIGAGAIILPGIKVGKCSIVGAGAVVTKDVPEYTIVAGVPAKVLKEIPRKLNFG